eukprot:71424-Hanusia_phi.AAC.1
MHLGKQKQSSVLITLSPSGRKEGNQEPEGHTGSVVQDGARGRVGTKARVGPGEGPGVQMRVILKSNLYGPPAFFVRLKDPFSIA